MNVLMLPRYGKKGASSRYRLWQYAPLFERAGHRVQVWPLLSDAYLDTLYASGRRPAGTLLAGYSRRCMQILSAQRFDVAICEQEALPYLPAWVEKLIWRRAERVFLDYDDAAYVRYENLPALRNKFARIMAKADGIVVGNEHLARFARQYSVNVSVIPTVVDLDKYECPKKARTDGVVRIAWIGIPYTAEFLKPYLGVFKDVQARHPSVIFRWIGAGKTLVGGELRAETIEWSIDTEVRHLMECDVGIMPLADTPFTRGKCGLKLIQYMACGMPVIASPVGVNTQIVQHGENGFLASSCEQWAQALNCLAADASLRHRIGQAAREKVESGYTLEQGFEKWAAVLDTCPSREKSPATTATDSRLRPLRATPRGLVFFTTSDLALKLMRGQCRYFREAGFGVAVVSSPGKVLECVQREEEVRAEPIPMAREISPLADAVAFVRICRLLRRLRPAIISAATPKAALLACVAGWLTCVPCRVYCHWGLRAETLRGWRRMILLVCDKVACGAAHRVVCVSESLRAEIVSLGLTKKEKTVVLGAGSSNGVDAERFAPGASRLRATAILRESLGIPANALVLGFVGRLTRDKGVEELLSAYTILRRTIPELRLLMLGDFESGDAVEPAVREQIERDAQIVRVGFVEDAAPYYHVFDVLALPTRREGFPNVVLEAHAAGKAVVATRATGTIDAIRDGRDGILVPQDDVPGLVRAIALLLENKALRERMGRAGRERVIAEFAPERIWDALAKEYFALLSARGIAKESGHTRIEAQASLAARESSAGS